MSNQRRYPIGAEVLNGDGVSFRVWAPRRKQVEVVLENGVVQDMDREPGGYFAATVSQAYAGDRYRFRLDGGRAFPDPASRYQPAGPHGASQIVDPEFAWRDAAWQGCDLDGQVMYEMHIGTFTR